MKSFSSCHVARPEPSSAKKKQTSPMASNSNSTIPTTIYTRTSRSIQTTPNRRPGAPKANGQPVNPTPENQAPVNHAPTRAAPNEQILQKPKTPQSHALVGLALVGLALVGHAKVLRIAGVLADLAPARTEPPQTGRNQVPRSVVAPESAALNPVDQNGAGQNPVDQNAAGQNPAGQNGAAAVAVRKASKNFCLLSLPASLNSPGASRLACRCEIDTLRPVGNP